MTTDPQRERVKQAKARFGAEVRWLRTNAGLTQAALARQIGYSRVAVTNVETGRDIPGRDFVRLVSAYFNNPPVLTRLYTAVIDAQLATRTQPDLSRLLTGDTITITPATEPNKLQAQLLDLARQLTDLTTGLLDLATQPGTTPRLCSAHHNSRRSLRGPAHAVTTHVIDGRPDHEANPTEGQQ